MPTQEESTERRIIDYLEDCYERGWSCPTVRGIAAETNLSKSSVQRYLSKMEQNGVLQKGKWGYETIQMRREDYDTVSVAILGSIHCGSLAFEEENIEGYVKLPESLVGSGSFYLLKAYGDSMIEAGIEDDDYVLVRQQAEAHDGDIVVALVENEVTLKRFFRDTDNRRIILHPENRKMKDIVVKACQIQGVAVKVLKDL